ncbi:MAG: hypothetical protein HY898_08125 [Deltaproteobacteria bacterium]|nr:hypothetical protein [Deltaproteobacteria bacterium]
MYTGRAGISLLPIAMGLAAASSCGGKVVQEAMSEQGGHAGSATGGSAHGGAGGSSLGGAAGNVGKGGAGVGGAGQGGSGVAGGYGGGATGGSAGWGVPPGCIEQVSYDCNPVTNAPCNTAAGEACDLGGGEPMVTCFPDGNVLELGQACDNVSGPWCKPTMTCVANNADASFEGTCRKFCCSLQDCPAGSVACTPLAPEMGSLGTCK